MKVNQKNMAVFIFAVVFLLGAIGCFFHRVAEYHQVHYYKSWADYYTVSYPYQMFSFPLGLIAFILFCVAFFVNLREDSPCMKKKETKNKIDVVEEMHEVESEEELRGTSYEQQAEEKQTK